MTVKEIDILMQQKLKNGDTNIMYPVTKVENVLDEENNPINCVTKYLSTVVAVGAWEASEIYYRAAIANENINSNSVVSISMDLANQEKMTDGYTESYEGGVYIYTSEKPTEEITLNLIITPAKGVVI